MMMVIVVVMMGAIDPRRGGLAIDALHSNAHTALFVFHSFFPLPPSLIIAAFVDAGTPTWARRALANRRRSRRLSSFDRDGCSTLLVWRYYVLALLSVSLSCFFSFSLSLFLSLALSLAEMLSCLLVWGVGWVGVRASDCMRGPCHQHKCMSAVKPSVV